MPPPGLCPSPSPFQPAYCAPVCFSVQVVEERLHSDAVVCRGLVRLSWGLLPPSETSGCFPGFVCCTRGVTARPVTGCPPALFPDTRCGTVPLPGPRVWGPGAGPTQAPERPPVGTGVQVPPRQPSTGQGQLPWHRAQGRQTPQADLRAWPARGCSLSAAAACPLPQ